MLPTAGSVLDVGCWDRSFLRYCHQLGVTGLKHFGMDREIPPGSPPQDYVFAQVDLEAAPFPFPEARFDGVVLSHVIEHLSQPLHVMDEAFRVLKAGGLLYLECPSHRSVGMPSMPFRFHEFRSLNFYDDPTHLGRPHTPQSLYRLFCMYGAEVVGTNYVVSTGVRLRFPWLIAKALFRRDGAMLEDIMWRTFGFAVFGIARKTAGSRRRYVLP